MKKLTLAFLLSATMGCSYEGRTPILYHRGQIVNLVLDNKKAMVLGLCHLGPTRGYLVRLSGTEDSQECLYKEEIKSVLPN